MQTLRMSSPGESFRSTLYRHRPLQTLHSAGASSPRANSTGIDRCKPFWPAYVSAKTGQRCWKRRQTSMINSDDDNTEFDADNESVAHNDDDIGTDLDVSEMQRSAVSCASLLPTRVSSPCSTSSSLPLSPSRSVFSSHDPSSSPGGCPSTR